MHTYNPRIGFHYFPDTAHYRQEDLATWLPELQRFGAGCVTLLAPAQRAIPEGFIAGLLAARIEPIIHFPFHCRSVSSAQDDGLAPQACIPFHDAVPPAATLRLLLNAYARWGVRKVVFFDTPNLRAMWSPSDWLQGDLVERFLDRFLPLAGLALEAGLDPVFPPLAPGGDYWDLSFLRSALRGLKRRSAATLLARLALGVEAFAGERPLEWGAGGPERWKAARPYHTPAGEQDHLGFRIFEWYLALSRQELGAALPVMLLRAGQRRTGVTHAAAAQPAPAAASAGPEFAANVAHARQNLAIAELLAAAPEAGGLPAEVLAGCFWLLSAAPRTPASAESWFPPAGMVLPVVGALQAWTGHSGAGPAPVDLAPTEPAPPEPTPEAPAADPGPAQETPAQPSPGDAAAPAAELPTPDASPVEQEARAPGPVPAAEDAPARSQAGAAARVEAIDHYILLPLYAWGAAEWDLALVQPLVQGGHATIGFSLTEARLARRVTVVGGPGAVSAEALAMLRKAGCQVERLMEDGTLIASS